MSDRAPHPSIHALEEMFEREWSLGDLCRAVGGDYGPTRLELEMFLLLRDPGLLLGQMAARLDKAFGVGDGFFQALENAYREDSAERGDADG
jgi:hypothetical protein